MTAIAEAATKSSEPQPRGNLEVIKKRRQVKVESPQESVRYFIAKENGVTTLPQLGKEFVERKGGSDRVSADWAELLCHFRVEGHS